MGHHTTCLSNVFLSLWAWCLSFLQSSVCLLSVVDLVAIFSSIFCLPVECGGLGAYFFFSLLSAI